MPSMRLAAAAESAERSALRAVGVSSGSPPWRAWRRRQGEGDYHDVATRDRLLCLPAPAIEEDTLKMSSPYRHTDNRIVWPSSEATPATVRSARDTRHSSGNSKDGEQQRGGREIAKARAAARRGHREHDWPP